LIAESASDERDRQDPWRSPSDREVHARFDAPGGEAHRDRVSARKCRRRGIAARAMPRGSRASVTVSPALQMFLLGQLARDQDRRKLRSGRRRGGRNRERDQNAPANADARARFTAGTARLLDKRRGPATAGGRIRIMAFRPVFIAVVVAFALIVERLSDQPRQTARGNGPAVSDAWCARRENAPSATRASSTPSCTSTR
jgi:hypothetical protein